jgi:hypothetical protein
MKALHRLARGCPPFAGESVASEAIEKAAVPPDVASYQRGFFAANTAINFIVPSISSTLPSTFLCFVRSRGTTIGIVPWNPHIDKLPSCRGQLPRWMNVFRPHLCPDRDCPRFRSRSASTRPAHARWRAIAANSLVPARTGMKNAPMTAVVTIRSGAKTACNNVRNTHIILRSSYKYHLLLSIRSLLTCVIRTRKIFMWLAEDQTGMAAQHRAPKPV